MESLATFLSALTSVLGPRRDRFPGIARPRYVSRERIKTLVGHCPSAGRTFARRLSSLRVQLVVAFMVVSIPAMLASAYVSARLMSNVFENSVDRWLGETLRFLRMELQESEDEANRIAHVIGRRLVASKLSTEAIPPLITNQLEVMELVGYDLIAIYDAQRTNLFASRPFLSRTLLPLNDARGLLEIDADGKSLVMVGAVHAIHIGDRSLFVLVGTWIDDAYLSGVKAVTSLDLRIFGATRTGYKPIFATRPDVLTSDAPPEDLIRELARGETVVFDQRGFGPTYRAVYSGLHGVDKSLVGVIFIGVERGYGFFRQISRWHLFSGIFLLGMALSTVVGLWMSGLLVRPLKALTAGVRSITSGDYRQSVSLRGGAEVAELAACFNSMATQLKKMSELEEALRRRDRLSALGEAAVAIAHEVRNPLGIIKTSTEVVRRRAHLKPAEDRMFGYIVDEVRRIDNLIREVLDFAHPKPLARDGVVLRMVVDRVVSLAAAELTRRKITVEIVEDVPGVIVVADADQLYQACLNLALNAMDAMPDGGRITITIGSAEAEATLTMTDSGSGVPTGIIDRIFNPFFTTKSKGAGLGLAKVQSVAELHGGCVRYAGMPGRGATFVLTLPLPSVRPAA